MFSLSLLSVYPHRDTHRHTHTKQEQHSKYRNRSKREEEGEEESEVYANHSICHPTAPHFSQFDISHQYFSISFFLVKKIFIQNYNKILISRPIDLIMEIMEENLLFK